MSNVYEIGFSYTVYGVAKHIEADSPEEAEKWLFDEIQQNGFEQFEHELFDKDWHTQDAKEVKDE